MPRRPGSRQGLAQLEKMQGLAWGDPPNEQALWIDGDTLYFDGRFASAKGPVFDVRAQGALGNGLDLDDVAFNKAFTLAAGFVGGRVYAPTPPVAYLIGSRIVGKSGVTFFGDGWTSVIKAAPGLTGAAGQMFYTDNSQGVTTNVVVRDLCFDGNKSNVAVSEGGLGEGSQSAIYLNQVDGARIENVLVTNPVSNGFYIVNSSTNVTVRDCHVLNPGKATSTGGRGFSIGISPSNIRIKDNYVTGSLKQGILLQSEGGNACQYVWITDNLVVSAGQQGIDLTDNATAGVQDIYLRDIVIADNVVISPTGAGIRLSSNVSLVNTFTTIIEKVQVHHNIVVGGAGIGIDLTVTNDGILRKCDVTDNDVQDCTGVGISVTDSANLTDVQILDNTFINNAAAVATLPTTAGRRITFEGNKTSVTNSTAQARTAVIPSATVYAWLLKAAIADANARFQVRADGQMDWGAGGASAVDVSLFRNAANQLGTDQMFSATKGLGTLVKAGTISDADFPATVFNGMMAIDSTNGRLYLRYGGAWHYITVTA